MLLAHLILIRITPAAPQDIVITQPMIILLIALLILQTVTKIQAMFANVQLQATVVEGQEVIIPTPAARLVLIHPVPPVQQIVPKVPPVITLLIPKFARVALVKLVQVAMQAVM